MIKVLLVSPFSKEAVGGIVNWTKYIVNYHRGHDEEVDLHLLSNESAVQIMVGSNTFQRLVAGLKNYLPLYRHFKSVVSREHYDVAHICSSASMGLIRDLLLVKAAQKKGIKTCLHMHFGRIPQILRSYGWEKHLMMYVFRCVDRIVVMDMASFNALKEIGFTKMVYLPNPLSSEVQQMIENIGDLEREPRKIVYAGHVAKEKGVYELVEACKQINQIKLELFGKEAVMGTRGELIQIAGDESESWLNIPGNKTLNEVIAAMKTCNIFVLPSYTEGFPNVIIEAMACGTAIVATSVGAIPEMLSIGSDKPCGICVPANDVAALRNAIVDLLGDASKVYELGRNAKKRVFDEYAMPIVWEKLVSIWRETSTSY